MLGYAVWLIAGKATVVVEQFAQYNTVMLFVAGVLGLYLLGTLLVQSIVPSNRWGLLLLGVFVILASRTFYGDDPASHVYLGDILSIVGIYLIIAGPSKMLLHAKTQEVRAEKDVEIIEV